ISPGSYSESINHYNVLRTIEDGFGLSPIGLSASATPILDVWTAPDGNRAPVASFTDSCVSTACSFDASASQDPDGTIAKYDWSFGDGQSGTGQTITHTYASSATYNV